VERAARNFHGIAGGRKMLSAPAGLPGSPASRRKQGVSLDTERDPLIFSAALRYRVCPDIMTPAVGFAGLGTVLEFGAPRRN
jgi:hypothetical protein